MSTIEIHLCIALSIKLMLEIILDLWVTCVWGGTWGLPCGGAQVWTACGVLIERTEAFRHRRCPSRCAPEHCRLAQKVRVCGSTDEAGQRSRAGVHVWHLRPTWGGNRFRRNPAPRPGTASWSETARAQYAAALSQPSRQGKFALLGLGHGGQQILTWQQGKQNSARQSDHSATSIGKKCRQNSRVGCKN